MESNESKPSFSKSEKRSTLKKAVNSNPLKSNHSRERGDCHSTESSETQYMKRYKFLNEYDRITKREFYEGTPSTSISTITFGCEHGPQGYPYTKEELLRKKLRTQLDTAELRHNEPCPEEIGWDVIDKIIFLIEDDVGKQNHPRIVKLIEDLHKFASSGFLISVLPQIIKIFNYLIDGLDKHPNFHKYIGMLIEHLKQPIILNKSSDVVERFGDLQDYFGYLGYLMMQLEDDKQFDAVSEAVLWQLSARPREENCVQHRHVMAAAAPVFIQIVPRMISVSRPWRFSPFIDIALLIAMKSKDNCLELVRLNIFENIFYRFNPYFPKRMLRSYDTGPADPQDINIKLGSSSIYFNNVISLLLVLVTHLEKYLHEDPSRVNGVPCPGFASLRCFIWAYRYECRARDHKHQRLNMTVFANALLICFGKKLDAFSTLLMPDVMSMCVLTEVAPRPGTWLDSVSINTLQEDAYFKVALIRLSVNLLLVFPENVFMVESQYWLFGLIYLLDPDLCRLRARWSTALFNEIRNVALQSLTCTVHLMPPRLIKQNELTRRILWYIEWYSVNPFELSVLYWCLRLMKEALYPRTQVAARKECLKMLFETHGVITLIHLCYTLLAQKSTPVRMSQVILGLSVRLITAAIAHPIEHVACSVYPVLTWPSAISRLGRCLIDMTWSTLTSGRMLSTKWMILLLNFIWEGIVWNKRYRKKFVEKNGIYKMLDILTMIKPPLQSLALALICDIVQAGDGIAQVITWRASLADVSIEPPLVPRGSSIATVIAQIFRNDCRDFECYVGTDNIIQDVENPLMAREIRELLASEEGLRDQGVRHSSCQTAAQLAGSSMGKVFSLLHLLSEDLKYKVAIADEAFNMYKNVELSKDDEVTLMLCTHFMSLKLGEVWAEVRRQCRSLLPTDDNLLQEFIEINRGWVRLIQKEQRKIAEIRENMEYDKKRNLYEFLGQARLTVALDALRDLRVATRAMHRDHLLHNQLHDAAYAHDRRLNLADKLGVDIIKTYRQPLDQKNTLRESTKVTSIVETKNLK